MSKKYKIAIVISHVIQYMIPLYHKINSHPLIDLRVYFCSDFGMAHKKDRGFGIPVAWDNITLEGLKYKFLKNYSPFPSQDTFFGLINLGLVRELKNNKFDAVIVYGYYNISYWLAILTCFFKRIPLILTGEPPTPFKSRFKIFIMKQLKKLYFPWLLNFSSSILYIGAKSKEFYLSYKRYVKDLDRKLFFCPYSVDNEYFFNKYGYYKDKKDAVKKELGLPLDLPVILFLSKLIKWKRPLLLLKAFKELKKEAVLVYVGTGYRLKVLKRYASKYKIKNVFFFGFKNYTEISKFYSIADVFVLPSLGEAWGLVINEALCFGLPVITTSKVNSAFDLIKLGENGYIIPPNNLKALKTALEELLDNPSKMKMMGRRSQEIIFGWNHNVYVEGLIKALDSLKNNSKDAFLPY
ncbi:MAG: glycosyltransferase family 4 protein [Candidatus Omnitrophica bacterium]|nr:glycosyltransferase family 4 protein [Candidatus Omnitrophota bacterium]